jgi:hypothetical protein
MASTVPAAKAALAALWTTAVTPVPVIVGPVVGVGEDAAVVVGYQDNFNPVAVDGTQVRASFGPSLRQEQYVISCAVLVNYGSIGVVDGETAVFTLWDQLNAVIDANPTLGVANVKNVVAEERFQLMPQQGADGLTVALMFGVAIDAFITNP